MIDTDISYGEEVANTVTHGIGAVAGLIAGVFLVNRASMHSDPRYVIGAVVFSAALVLLYSTSAIYHGAPGGPAKLRLEIMDHCAIFVLIAGTYTPFTLVSLRGVWGWSLFGAIWGLAAVGVLLKLIIATRFALLSTLLYIAMGWLVVVAAEPMVEAVAFETTLLLASGGVLYTFGTVFYHSRRIPYAHTIWHLFVIGGSVLHYLAVARELTG